MSNKIKDWAPTICSVLGGGLTLLSVFSAIHDTRKASVKLDELKDNNVKNPITIIKKVSKDYLPTIATTTGAIGLTMTGAILGKKTANGLMFTITALSQGVTKYKTEVKKALGAEEHTKIVNSIAQEEFKIQKPEIPIDGKKLYYEEHIGFFKVNPEKLKDALLKMQKGYCCYNYNNYEYLDCLTLKEFFDWAEAEPLDLELFKTFEGFGWNCEYLYEVYETSWVDYSEYKKDGDIFTTFAFLAEPIYNPEEPFEYDKYEKYIFSNNRNTFLDSEKVKND